MAKRHHVTVEYDDQRRILPEIDVSFHGTLRPFQSAAVNDLLKRDFGTLSAATGSGKTVMGLYLISARKQPALVIVHTKELLNQWVDRTETFLGIPKDEIGLIGSGKKSIGKRITVSLVQSLYKCADEIKHHVGYILVDECHRAPSRTFTDAITCFDCRFMTGLSATPYRRDKLSRLIYWYVGDVLHEVDKGALIDRGDILQAEVITRETSFETDLDASVDYSLVLRQLTQDMKRNRLICRDIAEEAKKEGTCIVLSDRKDHCKNLQFLLRHEFKVDSEVLTGSTTALKRKATVECLENGEINVLIATGQLIGEGFDCKHLSTMFLATPIKFEGRVLQYIGRILRPTPGKDKPKLYDYVDINVPVLVASAKSRKGTYGAA
jgi:superfamily II DNA or RNA helicase